MAFTKINAAGIGSTETVTLDGLTVINDGSFGGNVSVGGTLTYEDVTNIDSVGLITARNGIVVGSGITLSKDGDGFFTGVVTATSYAGDGSGLTGIAATDNVRTGILDVAGVGTFRNDVNIPDKIIHLGDTDTAIRFSGADTVNVETGGEERLRVDSTGQVRIFNQLYLTDNVPLYLGNANDFTLFHDSTDSRIRFNHAVGDLKFQNNSNTDLMVLDASGQMGLGTNNPSSFNAYARNFVIAQSSDDAGMTISAEDSGSKYGSIHFSGGTTLKGYIDQQNGTTGRMFIMNKMNGYMAFGTNNSERLRIASDGKVTIKTASNATSRLLFENTGSVRTNYIGLFDDDDRIVIAADDADQGSNSSIHFKVDGTERVTIDSSGIAGTIKNNYTLVAFIRDRDDSSKTTTSSSYQDDTGLVKNNAITYQQGDIIYARAFVPAGIALVDTDTANYTGVHIRLKVTPSSGSTAYSSHTVGWYRDDGRPTKETMQLTVTDYHISEEETPFSSGVTLSFQVQYKRDSGGVGSLGATGISNWAGERVLEVWQYRKAL